MTNGNRRCSTPKVGEVRQQRIDTSCFSPKPMPAKISHKQESRNHKGPWLSDGLTVSMELISEIV